MPTSNQPVETSSTWSAVDTSAPALHAAIDHDASTAQAAASTDRSDARMRVF
jgi:hypothetical protein